MAYVRRSSITVEFYGLAADPLPQPGSAETGADFGPGAKAHAGDTDQDWIWDGKNWQLIGVSDEQLAPILQLVLLKLEELILETRKLRRGLVFANDSVCIDVEDDMTAEE